MKIVSWNCNRSFRKKYQRLLELDADLYIIQECEPLDKITGDLKEIIANGIWEKGRKQNGLLVFAKPGISLRHMDWDSYGMGVYLPVLVNDTLPLVCVWAQARGYIEEFYVWYRVHQKHITDEFVLFGDFNSNHLFDERHDDRSHSIVVDMLEKDGLQSAYHTCTGEKQGEESIPTYYMYRKLEKGYHIDHCFVRPDRIQSYQILDTSWLESSDHIPIVLELHTESE